MLLLSLHTHSSSVNGLFKHCWFLKVCFNYEKNDCFNLLRITRLSFVEIRPTIVARLLTNTRRKVSETEDPSGCLTLRLQIHTERREEWFQVGVDADDLEETRVGWRHSSRL